jgi:hypothetical protein
MNWKLGLVVLYSMNPTPTALDVGIPNRMNDYCAEAPG